MTAMDLIEGIQGAASEFDRLVEGTRDDQLGNATPCAEFTVRDLVNHVASGAEMFAIAFEQGSVPDEELGRLMGGDYLGDDFKATLAASIHHAATAFSAPGALDGMVALPFGEMPREVALGIAVMDVMVHCSDLARGTGQELRLTDADAEVGLELAIAHGIDGMRDGGAFAAAIVVDDDADAWERLLAYTGRQP
jgi:uncharacterized protein (TIGR03086 family)